MSAATHDVLTLALARTAERLATLPKLAAEEARAERFARLLREESARLRAAPAVALLSAAIEEHAAACEAPGCRLCGGGL